VVVTHLNAVGGAACAAVAGVTLTMLEYRTRPLTESIETQCVVVAPFEIQLLRFRVSVMRTATTAPEANVMAATAHMAAGRPSASAIRPASSAPKA